MTQMFDEIIDLSDIIYTTCSTVECENRTYLSIHSKDDIYSIFHPCFVCLPDYINVDKVYVIEYWINEMDDKKIQELENKSGTPFTQFHFCRKHPEEFSLSFAKKPKDGQRPFHFLWITAHQQTNLVKVNFCPWCGLELYGGDNNDTDT